MAVDAGFVERVSAEKVGDDVRAAVAGALVVGDDGVVGDVREECLAQPSWLTAIAGARGGEITASI